MPVQCTCATCGKVVLLAPSIARRFRTCGRACPGRFVERVCVVCGKVFHKSPSELKGGRGHYCSVDCYHPPGDIWSRIERWTACSGVCHVWTGAVTGPGYPEITVDRKVLRVHRLVLERKLGRPIAPDMMACHQCEHLYPPGDISYRRCINPDHLEEGDKHRNAIEARRVGPHRRKPNAGHVAAVVAQPP